MNALRPLLSGIVDYAGLFPPAALDMAAAVRNFAEYRHDRDSWMLGRFIVPVSRLGEFGDALAGQEIDDGEWLVSALLSNDVAGDVRGVHEFNDVHDGHAHVDTLEGKLTTPAAIADTAAATEGQFAVFAEIPIENDPAPLVDAIASAHVHAKVRTGGVTPDAFPRAGDVVRFMRTCAARHVVFKATAGLHHPLRAEHRLTYAADAPRGTMYGYLNVFLTAALLDQLTDAEAVALLEEREPSALEVTRDSVRWRAHEVRVDQLGATRDLVAASFGSCSFREPVDELRNLSLLS